MTEAPCKACRKCGKALKRRNKTGFCKAHWQRAVFIADPSQKERMRAIAERNLRTPKATEARRRAAQASGAWRKALAAVTPEDRRIAGARSRATKLAWCPPELRDDYVFLVKRRGWKAAEAREIILRQHETDMARFRRSIGG